MNAERKLAKVKIALMRNPQFALWSGILMVGKTSVSDDVPTACTNGRDEIYGRAFVEKLNEKELAFVILHEAMHKAYRHLTSWHKLYKEHPMLANMACDYVINLELHDIEKKTGALAFPTLEGRKLGLLDEKFRGMNTKQVFDLLKKECEEGFDRGDNENPLDEHDWEGAQNLSDEEKEAIEKEIDRAIRQGVMAQKKVGQGAGGLSRELEEMLNPQVNWREVLREYVKSICSGKDASSWRKVNRRFLSSDTYMPTLVSERVGHLVIAVDTSGSIGGRELANFLSEVKGIAEEVTPDKVDLLYWDGEVAGHEEYDSYTVGNIINSTKPRGGGGTSPSCVSTYLKDKGIKPECIIMLTDGYVGSDWGRDWEAPVLWTIVGNNDAVAPNGRTVHVND
jgi:predicted metal-dependent peptidase